VLTILSPAEAVENTKAIVAHGVIGNTSDFGSEESRFET
jgi:hypothetical protein